MKDISYPCCTRDGQVGARVKVVKNPAWKRGLTVHQLASIKSQPQDNFVTK